MTCSSRVATCSAENVAAFEREFAAYLGVAHGVGVNCGTDALILVLRELGVRPGDEVITTPFTAIPTYAAIHHVGAVPVFVDIEADTFLMDLAHVDAAITPRTRGVCTCASIRERGGRRGAAGDRWRQPVHPRGLRAGSRSGRNGAGRSVAWETRRRSAFTRRRISVPTETAAW